MPGGRRVSNLFTDGPGLLRQESLVLLQFTLSQLMMLRWSPALQTLLRSPQACLGSVNVSLKCGLYHLVCPIAAAAENQREVQVLPQNLTLKMQSLSFNFESED